MKIQRGTVLESDTKKYINSFYEPDFSTYDFLSLFIALLADQETYSFDRDKLQEYIILAKDRGLFSKLLSANVWF